MTKTADHTFELPSESLVDQSIHNRIDSGIEQNQCVGKRYWNGSAYDRKIGQNKVRGVSKPANSKYHTDN